MVILEEPLILGLKNKEDKLSPEEHDEIIKALDIIKMGFRFENEEIQRRCEAEQAILRIGRKALPFLLEQLAGKHDNFYKYLQFSDALSEKEDLESVLEILASKDVLCNRDGSSAAILSRTTLRILREIRLSDPEDPRLEQASQKIIAMLKTEGLNPRALSDIYSTLVISGAPSARKYIKEHETELTNKNYLKFLDHPEDLSALDVRRHKFDTWEEILAMREPYRDQKSYQNTDSDFGGFEEYLNPEKSVFGHPIAVLDATVIKAIDRANSIVYESFDLEPTAIPAIKLHIFNYMREHEEASDDDVRLELLRMKRLSELERKASEDDNPLPTIGVEVEIPNEEMVQVWSKEILDELGVPNDREGHDLLEIKPNYSYSALPQARIIQEVAKMGLIRLTESKEGKPSKVNDWDVLSLHINLGLPSEITEYMHRHIDNMYRLNDVVTAAFTSPYRIENRKTQTSLSYNRSAAETKKNKKKNNQEDSSAIEDDKSLRLELRANEFRDYPTYRLLIEVQRLGAMLFANIKKVNALPMSSKVEEELAELWEQFNREGYEYLSNANYSQNLADTNKSEAANILRNTTLKADCRELIRKYSMKIAKLIKE